MKMQKTWASAVFSEGDARIEVSFNYDTDSYNLTHGNNDNNVTFNGGDSESMALHLDRAKCVAAALRYIKSELSI
jgi:hypothetical protein